MKRFCVVILACSCLLMPLCAQSTKVIEELKNKRGLLQKQIRETEMLLKTTKKDVGSQLAGLAALTGQIEERKRYITTINGDVNTLGGQLRVLEIQLFALEADLRDKKKKYDSSVQYLYKNRSIQEKLMIFPFLTQAMVDTGIGSSNISFVVMILIAQMCLVIGQMANNVIRSWLMLHITTRISISLISDFLNKLMRLPIAFFDSKHTGDILQRIHDYNRIQSFLTGALISTAMPS